tara:strand:- start:3919 stop:4158 length:240 start_codon:yes stop_codon:yes gene_type:complete
MSTLFEILNKRTEFERLVSFRKSFVLPSYESDIESLKYFINNGYAKNRFRKNYKKAFQLASEIVEYHEKSQQERMELLD